MKKYVFLCLFVILTASSIVSVTFASASITKPSIPEFTLKFVAHTSDTPTTYSIDPFTGANVAHPGSHSEWTTLDVTLKNQPFTPYADSSSATGMIDFYYNIRIKGHFGEDWIELYRASDGYPTQNGESVYTVISYKIGITGGELNSGQRMVTVYGQVDFQVEAMTGWVSRVGNPNATNMFDMYPWMFSGEVSGWSNTQTLTFDGSAPVEDANPSASNDSANSNTLAPQNSSQQAPNTEPSQSPIPESIPSLELTTNAVSGTLQLEVVIGMVIAVATVVAVAALVYLKKRRR